MIKKIISFLIVFLMCANFSIAYPQDKTKKLDKNDDPDMIGKRDINNNQINFVSIEKEIEIGQQLANEIDRQAQFVTDPQITEYINRLGQNIAINSDAKVPFTIKVIDSMDVNAFALPGGFFYVNKGLLIDVESESELVGVMAHEIAHVACRHAMEQQSKGRILNIAMLPAVIFGGPVAPILMGPLGNILIPLTFLKFSRGMEEEADRYGAQYAYKAGYDPSSLVSVFKRLELKQGEKSKGGFAGVFSSHPNNKTRMRKVDDLIIRFPIKDEYIYSSSDFKMMKEKLQATARANLNGHDPNDPNSTPQNNGRPTLKRRTDNPISDDPLNKDADSDKTDDQQKKAPPTLKRNSPPTQDNQKDDDKDDNE